MKINPMFHFANFLRRYEKEFARKFLRALRPEEKSFAMLLIEQLVSEMEENLKVFYQELMAKTAGELDKYFEKKIEDEVLHDRALKAMYDSLYMRSASRITALMAEQKEMLGYVLKELGVQISYSEYASKIKTYIGLNKPQAQRLLKIEQELIEQGESPDRIQKIIEKTANKMKRYRALMIARTELAYNYTQGQVSYLTQVRDDTGFKIYKTWNTSPDELTCETCSALDGETVEIDQMFSIGVAGPPAHPNCRCYLTYERRD